MTSIKRQALFATALATTVAASAYASMGRAASSAPAAFTVEEPQIARPDLREIRRFAVRLQEPAVNLPPAVQSRLIPAPAPIIVGAPQITWPDLREMRTLSVKLRKPKVDLPPIFPRWDS